jgi:hypothetical protein
MMESYAVIGNRKSDLACFGILAAYYRHAYSERRGCITRYLSFLLHIGKHYPYIPTIIHVTKSL